MLNLLLTGALFLQESTPRPAPPVTRNHRFLLTHQAKRQIISTEWWCSDNRLPSTARFEILPTQIRDQTGRSTGVKTEVTLLYLSVNGERPSKKIAQEVRTGLAPLNYIGDLYGRCLHRSNGRTMPVLLYKGYVQGTIEPRRVEVDLVTD